MSQVGSAGPAPRVDPAHSDRSVDSADTMRSLHELAEVLDRTSGEITALAGRARALADHLTDGTPLREVMPHEERPLLITHMTRLVDEMTRAALAVRRAEARQLRREGLSHQGIGTIFGVTRQRVAALLSGGVEGPESDA